MRFLTAVNLREGALAPGVLFLQNYYPQMPEQAMTEFGIDMDKLFEELTEDEQQLIFFGSEGREFHFHYEITRWRARYRYPLKEWN